MRYCCRMLSASSRVSPWRAVTSLSLVIISVTGFERSFWKRRSRLVRIPISFPLSSTTGIPPILDSRMILCASPRVAVAESVIGSMIMPLSERLTLRTWSAWASMLMFLWMIPIPPSCAIAMASADSVTVSIAAEISGMFSWILRVSWVMVLVSRGRTSE